MIYAYFGDMDLHQPEYTWVVAHRMPLLFIADSIRDSIAAKRLKQVPPSLNLEVPTVFKVQTNTGLWVLNMDGADHTIEANGAPLAVPAHTILRP